jgi:diguanylate cyclase (GGDEF)-like protein
LKENQVETGDGFKYINRRYAAALLITALLLLVSQVIIQMTIINMKSDAHVVNLSGRQRMLSQKITKSAFGVFLAQTEKERDTYVSELEKAASLWKKTHLGLRYGSKEPDLPGGNSGAVNALYDKMEPHYEAIIRSVERLIYLAREHAGNDRLAKFVKNIRENEIHFLGYMDKIVFQYDAESNSKLLMLQILELSILFVALVVLVVEWRLVFKPAQKEIREGFENIRKNEEYLNKLFETSPSITILFDAVTLKAVKYNAMAIQLAREWLNIELSGETAFADLTPGMGDAELTSRLLQRIRNEKEFSNMEVEIFPGRIVMLSAKTVHSGDRDVYLIGFSDITMLKQMATFDSMTNMLNRRSGMELLSYLFEQDVTRDISLALCFIDIDNLKVVNDEYGHQEGDFYIQMVAKAINDVMGERYKCIRYGGDEMIVVAEGNETLDFERQVRLVSTQLDVIRRIRSKPYRMSISYGIAWYPGGNSSTFIELIEEADINMYEQKKQKRAIRKREEEKKKQTEAQDSRNS